MGGTARAIVHPLLFVVVVPSCGADGARASRHPPYPSYRYPLSGRCGRATLTLSLPLLSLTPLGGRAREGAVEFACEGGAEVDLARGRVGVRVGVGVRVRVGVRVMVSVLKSTWLG